MTDPDTAYATPSERWLGEYLDQTAARYLASPDYRRRLNRERSPLFASKPRTAA